MVTYYSWTKINLKKDFTAVFSVTNCENTWDIFTNSLPENLLLMAVTDPGKSGDDVNDLIIEKLFQKPNNQLKNFNSALKNLSDCPRMDTAIMVRASFYYPNILINFLLNRSQS